MYSIVTAILAWAIKCVAISVYCFNIYVHSSIYTCVHLTAHDIDTLGSVLSPEVVLDYEQPYSYGTYSNPKQLRVEENFSVILESVDIHTD